MVYVPGGRSTQHEGVAGNISLPSVLNASEELGEKNLDNSLPAASIAPFLGKNANSSEAADHWAPVNESLVKKLKEKSVARVAKDTAFKDIKKDIAEMKKNKGVIRLSDVLKKSDSEKQKKKAEEAKSIAQRTQEADAPYLNESVNILMDWVISTTPTAPTAKN
jgi:carboxyl-terminal processing protease